MEAISAESISNLSDFGAQALANTAWAFATLASFDKPLMDSLAAESIAKLSEFGQQQLSNLAWAFATLASFDKPLMDSLAAESIAKLSEFGQQQLSNLAWAFATLGYTNKELMEAMAAESIRKIQEFDPQNLSNIAWAYAKLGMTHDPLLEAIAAEAISKLTELTPRECAGLSWSFATLRSSNGPLLDAISRRALALVGEFESLDLSTISWAYDTLKLLDGPVREAITANAIAETDSMENQPLATLVDIDLPGCESLAERLTAQVGKFADRWLTEDAFKASNSLLFDWQVDNFGVVGTALLLSRVGVHRPVGSAVQDRALARVAAEEAGRGENDWRAQRFFYKERVYCYTEHHLEHPSAKEPESLLGSMLKENSFLGEGTRAGKTGLLKSMVLPINELVDRTLCAEFQTLSELCDLLDSVGVCGKPSRCFVTGTVWLWTSGASCLSCVGVMRQFLHLFPNVTLEVLCVRRLH